LTGNTIEHFGGYQFSCFVGAGNLKL
jgi:hypothetical protein